MQEHHETSPKPTPLNDAGKVVTIVRVIVNIKGDCVYGELLGSWVSRQAVSQTPHVSMHTAVSLSSSFIPLTTSFPFHGLSEIY